METYVLDASENSLGRIAAKAAILLMGKNRPTFERHVKKPVTVIVKKSDELRLTGRKWQQKIYYRHSGYLGHLKETTAEKMKKKDSRRMVYAAVMGMLPKNKLRARMIKNLKIFKGDLTPKKDGAK